MSIPIPPLAPPAGPLERLPEEWSATLSSWGQPAYRGGQVFRWIHQRGVLDPAEMTDLPKALRARLAEEGLGQLPNIAKLQVAQDTTRKLLLELADGKRVETVLIPQKVALQVEPDQALEEGESLPPAAEGQPYAVGGKGWVSQCISSQVGCAMGCVFCASGVAGLQRHLTAGEIIGQVLLGRAQVAEHGHRLRNVVMMGMGEPLHNYDAVARALVLMTHPDGLNLSRRRVTLSTSGLVPEIDRLGREFGGQVQLAVSLHQVDDADRSALMPINKRYPISELMASLARYPLPKRRRITIEYTLVKGQNDTVGHADRLARLLRGLRVKVNLIPMNPIEVSSLGPSDWESVERFQQRLRDNAVAAFVRRRKGDDIAAACGQLALEAGSRRKLKVTPLGWSD